MSISAIAKKRLAFHDDKGGFITVLPGEFVSLPDYVRKDPMYAWAVKDGVLVVSDEIISSVTTEAPKVPEEAPKVPKKVEEAEEASVEEAIAPQKRTTKKKG